MNIVIMAGGCGTRLWPMSRTDLPKQLQKIVGDKTLIQQTYERISPLTAKENIYIGTVAKYLEPINNQLPGVPKENIIIEPKLKNTAGAIGLVAIRLWHKDPKSIMVSLHSDHAVTKVDNFHQAIKLAVLMVEKHPEFLFTVGIKPTYPSTGFGYIKMNGLLEEVDKQEVFKVEKFIEKPDLATAEKFISDWQYLWNAGYFIWRVDTLLELYKQHLPNTYNHLMAIEKAIGKPEYQQVLEEHYDQIDEVAVDVGILENTDRIAVVPADLGWSDIGSWSDLHDLLVEITGDPVITKGEHVGVDNENCLIYGDQKLIATVGLKGVIIVDTPDVLFVADKSKAHQVKKVIEQLKEQNKHHYL